MSRETEEEACGHCGEGVEDVVVARNGEVNLLKGFVMQPQSERSAVRKTLQVGRAQHRTFVESVGQNGHFAEACGDAHGARCVGTDGNALACLLHDGSKALFDFVGIAEVIQVVEVDIGDDCHGRMVVSQRPIALISLGNRDTVGIPRLNGFAVDGACVGVQTWRVTAQTPQRIFANALQEARGETACRGLTVRTTNGDRTQDADPSSETFATREHRNARLARCDEFGVVCFDRGTVDECITRGEVTWVMVLRDMDVVAFEKLCPRGRNVAITPRNLPTFQVKHPRNGGGTDTADAHDVDAFGRE